LTCEFAEKAEGMMLGCICKLNRISCFNADKDDVVVNCPTLGRFQRGELVPGTPALDYPGVPHVVRQGKYGSFNPGMPFEYLRGNLNAKNAKDKK